MDDATGRPRRMGYSFETQCRAVAAILQEAVVQAVGTPSGGHLGGAAGVPVHPAATVPAPESGAEAEILAARRRSGAGPVTLGALLGRPAFDRGQRAAAVGPLAPHAGAAAARRALRARPARVSGCPWTPRSWAASGISASASTAMASSAAREPVGSTCTSPLTTIRGCPTPWPS